MTRSDLQKLLVDLLELVTKSELSEIAEKLPVDQQQEIEPLLNALVAAGKITKFQARTILKGRGKGLLLGAYLVLDKLGQGGFGTVFEARHRMMGRSVALKLMHPDHLNNQSTIDRFLREVRAAAKLEDPHIVKAYDANQVQGTYFLAMELVRGKVLSDLVKENGALPLAQCVDYVIQAAKGLEYAHRQGVIHRDIKPANLILDELGKVRVLDMGLARLDTVEESSRQQLTRAGTSLGTSDYMAPEQALDSIRADQRSDIYSLGCTLYGLVCGQVIFPSNSETKRLLDHQTTPAPELKVLRPDAPGPLEVVYQKMVAKKPEARYQTMVEVLQALDSLKSVVGEVLPPKTTTAVTPAKPREPDNDVTGLSRLVKVSSIQSADIQTAEVIPVEDLREPPAWKRYLNQQPPQVLLAIAGAALLFCVVIGWALSGSQPNSVEAFARSDNPKSSLPERSLPQTPESLQTTLVVEPIKTESNVPVIDQPAPAIQAVMSKGRKSEVIFQASFEDAANGVQWRNDTQSKTEGELKYVHGSFHKSPPEESGLKVQTQEVTDPGFDGRPGCLRISFEALPKKLDFLGFKIGGHKPHQHIILPTWTPQAITLADLEQTTMEFRYRTFRPAEHRDTPLKFQVRIEQNHSANYATRLDFEAVECTENWALFSARLSDAQNVVKFLEYAKENTDGGFSLVFSPFRMDGLVPGDQFEFDDLKFLSSSDRAIAVATIEKPKTSSPQKVVLKYSFEDATGSEISFDGVKQTTEGTTPYRMGLFGKLAQGSAGQLLVVAKDDESWTGPDGEPGVFGVRIAELPEKLSYVGFTLSGKGAVDRIPISSWTPGQTTAADLEKTTLEFRHRLVRAAEAPQKPLKFNLRLEPAATADPHGKSIQLPSFEATNEWRTHSVKLSTAPKPEVFLGHINSAYTNRVQITFDFASQQDLLAGDMILLDDVKFLSQ